MQIFKNDISKLERLTQRERLGELLIRHKILSIDKLVELMNEYKVDTHGAFGEFLVDNNYINRKQLLDLLNSQKTQDKVIDSCLKKLGFMTNSQKWEVLTRTEKIGELLIKFFNVKFADLIKCIEQQENTRPERLLGDIIVERGFITNTQLDTALDLQRLQHNTIDKTINELRGATQLPINVKVRLNNLWISFR